MYAFVARDSPTDARSKWKNKKKANKNTLLFRNLQKAIKKALKSYFLVTLKISFFQNLLWKPTLLVDLVANLLWKPTLRVDCLANLLWKPTFACAYFRNLLWNLLLGYFWLLLTYFWVTFACCCVLKTYFAARAACTSLLKPTLCVGGCSVRGENLHLWWHQPWRACGYTPRATTPRGAWQSLDVFINAYSTPCGCRLACTYSVDTTTVLP